MLILQILIIYFLVVFILTRSLVPYMGFFAYPVPEKLPPELQAKIDLLAAGNSPEQFLFAAYELVTAKYHGGRAYTLVRFWRAWLNPFGNNAGFAPCNVSNYLLRAMLITSGQFRGIDIQVRYTFLNFFIHQYLRVRVGEQWIDVDPWGKAVGIVFGKHARLFV